MNEYRTSPYLSVSFDNTKTIFIQTQTIFQTNIDSNKNFCPQNPNNKQLPPEETEIDYERLRDEALTNQTTVDQEQETEEISWKPLQGLLPEVASDNFRSVHHRRTSTAHDLRETKQLENDISFEFKY